MQPIPLGYERLDEAFERFCVEFGFQEPTDEALSAFAGRFARGDAEAFLYEQGELRRVPRERWNFPKGNLDGILRGCWASASFLGDGREAPLFVERPKINQNLRGVTMSGIPVGFISTAELCEMVRASVILREVALTNYEARFPNEVEMLTFYNDAVASAPGYSKILDPAVCPPHESQAIAAFVLTALHLGELELSYIDGKSSERFRFDSRLFGQDNAGHQDILGGRAPMFGPHEHLERILSMPQHAAVNWLKQSIHKLAAAPLPPGFWPLEILMRRLDTYCRAKGDVAHGVVKPGTDDYGNWTNSGEEFEGRLLAQIFRHLLAGLQSGDLEAEYWRRDTGDRQPVSRKEWNKRQGDGGTIPLRRRLPLDPTNELTGGASPAFAAMFGDYIFEQKSADAFLLKFAPMAEVPRLKASRRGRRAMYDWEGCYKELDQKFEHHGDLSDDDPDWNAQADVEKVAAQFFSDKGGSPATSTVREHVVKYLAKRSKLVGGR